MALKLTFDPASPLLNGGSFTSCCYYVRATGIQANTLTNTGIVPLFYKASGPDGQPAGEWLTGLELPTAAPIMDPRALMMETGTTPYKQAYELARTLLRARLGDQATVEDLL